MLGRSVSIKERVNGLNFAEELDSLYFDMSCQNGAFNVFKILPMLLHNSVNEEYCKNGRG